jgi:hypothetical protein
MTATPHNGKEEDFQLFLSLLDADRFEGRFRDGVHVIDPSDIMRRLVKEQLLKFDGKPLFPERRAYSPTYRLSDAEAHLYKRVTDYVREEFNRADNLEEGRRGTIGFALTILQRRLASSPEAIYQSLRRRRERLESRLREEALLQRGGSVRPANAFRAYTADDLDDLDEAPDGEIEAAEDEILDEATAARTVAELQAEIEILKGLEALAHKVRHSGTDRKWDELSRLLQDVPEMKDAHGHRRKLVIFTEHRDTLSYLHGRIAGLLGRPDAVVVIHGSLGRDERRKTQERFTQSREVEILVATDAAGEGINLQRAHLMVNYDLPWNPNRLEQRFGRIHRIGQTEVCHLWNLVAEETREGDVFKRLFEKLEVERQALGAGVFDILGQLFRDQPLRQLLIEAVRYGDRPETRAKLDMVVDNLADRDRCRELLEQRALAKDSMDASAIRTIREQMERAEARRLQPHHVGTFFLEAFRHLGGRFHQREPKRCEISRVPAAVRSRDRQIGRGAIVLDAYERVTFDKQLINVPGQPLATFVCPGHPLLDATLDLVLERYRDQLKRGAVLVDPDPAATEVRTLFYLEHPVVDARRDAAGAPRTASRQVHFVEVAESGEVRSAGWAPHLDYRPPEEAEQERLQPLLAAPWLREDLEAKVTAYAVENIALRHLKECRDRREDIVTRTAQAVHERLTKEINHWDHRANELRLQEQAGRQPRLNSAKARQRADELQGRLKKRLAELEKERRLSALPPVVVGGALIVPARLLAQGEGAAPDRPEIEAKKRETARIEALAMQAVMEAERRLGFEPRDVSAERCGYDIESRVPGTGKLRFIEVKGRHIDGKTITVTRNEILTALNKPDDFILAIVQVDGALASPPGYVLRPFSREPDFHVTSVNYDFDALLKRAEVPNWKGRQ